MPRTWTNNVDRRPSFRGRVQDPEGLVRFQCRGSDIDVYLLTESTTAFVTLPIEALDVLADASNITAARPAAASADVLILADPFTGDLTITAADGSSVSITKATMDADVSGVLNAVAIATVLAGASAQVTG